MNEAFSGTAVAPPDLFSERQALAPLPAPKSLDLKRIFEGKGSGPELSTANVPSVVLDHIHNSSEIDQSSIEIRDIGISGAFEPVRTMVLTDFVLGSSRGAYELYQGIEDFGWVDTQPGWRRPAVTLKKGDDQVQNYTGEEDFVGSSEINFENHGILPSVNVLLLGQDTSRYEGDIREGGYGQGLKIFLTMAVSNHQDRREALELLLEDPKAGLSAVETGLLEDKLAAYRENHDRTDNNFAYVQSRDEDGSYYRIYAYRQPVHHAGRNIWALRYVYCRLNNSQIREEEQDRVIVKIVNPDEDLANSFNQAPDNILALNPAYRSDHSLVRQENDDRPLAPVVDRTSRELQTDPYFKENGGYLELERLDGVVDEPGFFFRGVRMEPQAVFLHNLRYSWNIRTVDSTAVREFNRTNNSRRVTGRVDMLISYFVASYRTKEEWMEFFNLITGPERKRFGPEVRPYFEVDFSPLQLAAISEAFNALWPQANYRFATNESSVKVWRAATKQDIEVPIFDSELTTFFKQASFSPIESEIVNLIGGNVKVDNLLYIDVIPLQNLERLLTEADSKSALDCTLSLMLDENALNFGAFGVTYSVDEQGFLKFETQNHGLSPEIRVASPANFFVDPTEGKRDFLKYMLLLASKGYELELLCEESTDHIIGIKKMGDGYCFYRGSASLSDRAVRNGPVLRIKSNRGTEDLVDLMTQIDHETAGLNPSWIEKREMSSILTALVGLREQRESLAAQVDEQQAKVDALLAEIERQRSRLGEVKDAVKEELELIIESTPGVGQAIEDSGMIGGPDGVAVREIYPDSFFGHGSKSVLLENGLSKEIAYQTSPEAKERVFIDRVHFRISCYGESSPNFHPLQAVEDLVWSGSGIRMEALAMDLTDVSRRDGRSIWRGYYPEEEGSQVLERFKGYEANFHALMEIDKDMRVGHGHETVLPIDSREYEIAYIQIPIQRGERPGLPTLFHDTLNDQYLLRCKTEEEQAGAIANLPAGTRFYLKKRERSLVETSRENYLQTAQPEYYASLTRHLLVFERLDSEARFFLKYLRKNRRLSRNQLVEAVYQFWSKRQRYDVETPVESIEDLISHGLGVCRHSAIAFLDLLRAALVPCRLRGGYPDNRQTGILQPPLHAEIEYLDDRGVWQRIDPPNSRVSEAYAKRAVSDISGDETPIVMDAPGLNRSRTEAQAGLPAGVMSILGSMQETPAGEMPRSYVNLAEEILYGRSRNIGDRLHAVRQIAAELRTEPQQDEAAASALQKEQEDLVSAMIRGTLERFALHLTHIDQIQDMPAVRKALVAHLDTMAEQMMDKLASDLLGLSEEEAAEEGLDAEADALAELRTVQEESLATRVMLVWYEINEVLGFQTADEVLDLLYPEPHSRYRALAKHEPTEKEVNQTLLIVLERFVNTSLHADIDIPAKRRALSNIISQLNKLV